MEYGNKLICHTVITNDYARLPDDYFDFFFSFGVLCHQNRTDQLVVLCEVLANTRLGAKHFINTLTGASRTSLDGTRAVRQPDSKTCQMITSGGLEMA